MWKHNPSIKDYMGMTVAMYMAVWMSIEWLTSK